MKPRRLDLRSGLLARAQSGQLRGAMITRRALIAAAIVLLCFEAARAQNTKVDQNVQVMMQAARSLKFLLPENKAVALEKEVEGLGVTSVVAIIFGYADNRDACEQIAAALSSSLVPNRFRCSSIY